jgi:cell fate (sporulation/competence/biofilm development) regulator YlbF (YheA/YmcA/DUF963 family)
MDNLASKINEEIKNSDVYKEYMYYKISVEKDEKLMTLKTNLDALKNSICASRDEVLVDEYYKKENEYKNNPLMKDYIRSKEQLNDLLKDIVDILSLN